MAESWKVHRRKVQRGLRGFRDTINDVGRTVMIEAECWDRHLGLVKLLAWTAPHDWSRHAMTAECVHEGVRITVRRVGYFGATHSQIGRVFHGEMVPKLLHEAALISGEVQRG